jgi:DNA anti-recombination protein RmuC
MNEILDIAALLGIVVSAAGGYFYIKFKLGEVERIIQEHKANMDKETNTIKSTMKEELIHVHASKTAMKAELQQRCDEKTADMKERHNELKDSIEKQLSAINTKLDSLISKLINNEKTSH